MGLAGLGAVLAAVSEASLRKLGTTLLPSQSINWHALSSRIVGGDAAGGLSALSPQTQALIQPAVHHGVAQGFAAAFVCASAMAVLASILVWVLLRPTASQQ
jgi:hypothetical protein